MYSARFCKSSLTDARRAIGKGKSALKTALTKADKGFSGSTAGGNEAGPPAGSSAHRTADEDLTQQTSLLDTEPADAAFPLPKPLLAQDGTVFLQELPEGAAPTAVQACRPLCRTGWRPTRRPMPTPSCSSSTLRCRISPRAAERYDAHFVTQLTARGSELEWAAALPGPCPLCGCQPCRRAGGGTVQRNAHPAGLLPLRAGLSRCPGRGTGKPVSARTSGALLPARHLHPLPGPGGQRAGRLGCAGRAGPGQGGQLSGLFPQLRLSAAGARGLHRPLPGHRHAGAGERSERRRPGRPFWNSLAQAPQKRCWASGSWAASLARVWIWRATGSSGAPSWGWACLR